MLRLRGWMQAFSSCDGWRRLSGPGVWASHCGASLVEHRLQSAGSVGVVHGFSSSLACGIFLDQESNPCPLPWQANSYPMCHQGGPWHLYYHTTQRGFNTWTLEVWLCMQRVWNKMHAFMHRKLSQLMTTCVSFYLILSLQNPAPFPLYSLQSDYDMW